MVRQMAPRSPTRCSDSGISALLSGVRCNFAAVGHRVPGGVHRADFGVCGCAPELPCWADRIRPAGGPLSAHAPRQ